MEGKSSFQRSTFCYVYLPNVRAKLPDDDSEFENFSPNYRKFAIECNLVRFPKTYEIWVFLEEKIGCFRKEPVFSKSINVAYLLLNANQMMFFFS